MIVRLEVIHRQPAHQIFPAPLLFVHGANGGAWLWDEHFLSFFAHYGYDAYALSLRGHGMSAGSDMLRWTSLADYATDVNKVICQLGGAVVLIGHSMGATIVLKCLQKQRLPAAALMAPVPVDGLLEASLLLAWRDPALFWNMSLVQSLGPWAGSYATMRRALFADSTPDSLIRPYFTSGWQAESPRAIIDMMGLDLPRVDRIVTACTTRPLLVCGAEWDALFSKQLVQETAQVLGTTAKFFSMGHAMMLEPNWEEPAFYIHQWLQDLVLSDLTVVPQTTAVGQTTGSGSDDRTEQPTC